MHHKPTDHPNKKTHILTISSKKRHVSLFNVGLFEYDFKASLVTVITDIVNFSVI